MQGVVVSCEPVDNCLLRCRLVPNDPVWLLVFRDRLRGRRTRDRFGELLARRFRAYVKRRALFSSELSGKLRTKEMEEQRTNNFA